MNLEDLKEGDYLIYTERPYSDYADGLELIEASPEGLRARSVARRDVGGGSFKLYTDPKPWLLAAYFDPKCWFPATDFVPGNCPIAYLLRWFKNHEITEAGVAVQRRALVPHSVIAYRWGTTNDHSYPVGAYPDFESAKAAADAECEYRGGKYGVSVFVGGRAGDREPATHQIVYHAPSMAGEDKPETNPIRDIEHLLGSRVLRMHDGDSYEQIEEYAAKLAEFYKIKRIAQP
jgi:hypothetical protein